MKSKLTFITSTVIATLVGLAATNQPVLRVVGVETTNCPCVIIVGATNTAPGTIYQWEFTLTVRPTNTTWIPLRFVEGSTNEVYGTGVVRNATLDRQSSFFRLVDLTSQGITNLPPQP